VGLALSGGGIRSATFCLGLLQGLHDLGLLRIFDYLSTVSGGGYVGGWWSAWLSRPHESEMDIFPGPERNELRRSTNGYSKEATESSESAYVDPIHHLRLFNNYLTPRKGLLSPDTWRATVFVVRNLLLTWLVLLPILVTVVLAGQLYYTLPASRPDQMRPQATSFFPHEYPPVTSMHGPSSEVVLKERLKLMSKPLIALAVLLFYCVALWLTLNQSGPLWVSAVSGEIFIIFLFFCLDLFLGLAKHNQELYFMALALSLLLLPAGLVILWALTLPRWSLKGSGEGVEAKARWTKEIYRNKLGRIQMRLLVILTSGTIFLTLTGFGHELVDYVCCSTESSTLGTFLDYLTKSVSLSALFGTVAGLIYTWTNSSPSANGGHYGDQVNSPTSRLIFALTPSLVLLVLSVLIAWVAHGLLWRIIRAYGDNVRVLDNLTHIGVVLCFLLAAVEIEWVKTPLWFGKMACLLFPLFILITRFGAWQSYQLSMIAIAVSSGLIFFKAVIGRDSIKRRFTKNTRYSLLSLALFIPSLIVGFVFVKLMGGFLAPALGWGGVASNADLADFASSGLVGCTFFYLFILWEQLRGGSNNGLPFSIVSCISVVLSALLLLSFTSDGKSPTSDGSLAHVVVVLIVTSLVWVIALGWMIDPNSISMHSFYRARLVRAYLGASNPVRNTKRKEITEAVEGDDVLLKELSNCERGAPYHIINSTLNLVGGRDLATAQRASAMFIFSKLYCGSLRTGYRRTTNYMGGELSLGTAVAVSGAAVSPNMGALKTSTPLAMLLTLLNVRLGFWAPTPSRSRWQAAQMRIWPFYTIREFLSMTDDLSSYCYLTDGGHFDNTGLYSLVQRGCRHIVLADCGADPTPCFRDLGDALRRCRIDFGAEFELDISPFLGGENKKVKRHYTVGKITYAEDHVKLLSWPDRSEEARTGYIILCKPSLTAGDTADVRQYAIENSSFPHQTTADQWFDEAQFESYRRLGQSCAEEVFGHACDSAGFDTGGGFADPDFIPKLFTEVFKRGSNEPVEGGARGLSLDRELRTPDLITTEAEPLTSVRETD
jgi:hypothetical protein